MGVLALNLVTNLLYGLRLTDEATCYKVFRADLLKALPLRCERFEFCPEVTALVAPRGERILELPIAYHFRTRAQGKKIGWRDAFKAFFKLLRYRFTDDAPAPQRRRPAESRHPQQAGLRGSRGA